MGPAFLGKGLGLAGMGYGVWTIGSDAVAYVQLSRIFGGRKSCITVLLNKIFRGAFEPAWAE